MPTPTRESHHPLPRAEFRVFGHGIVDIVQSHIVQNHIDQCATTCPTPHPTPPETYLISAHSTTVNVKIRNSMLDIKIMTGQTPEGYEIFTPYGKYGFPISAEKLQQILTLLNIDMDLHNANYSIEECMSLAQRHPAMAAVVVKKTRHIFMVQNVMCEYATVCFNNTPIETACCESADHAHIRPVVQALGIAMLLNTNYIAAAHRIIGIGR